MPWVGMTLIKDVLSIVIYDGQNYYNQMRVVMASTREAKKLASYILYSEKKFRLRPTPNMPVLYYSFSMDDLANALKAHNMRASHIDFSICRSIPNQIANKIIKIILREWRDKAGLPIEILETTNDATSSAEKNVVYIIHCQSLVNTGQDAVASRHKNSNKQVDLQVIKLFRENYININAELTAKDIYVLLHEVGHSVGLKHPISYEGGAEEPPYSPLDCTLTVMGYYDLCNQVIDSISRELAKYPLEVANKYKQNGAYTSLGAYQSAYPTTIGSVDIAAAQFIKRRWAKLNKDENNQKINASASTIDGCYATESSSLQSIMDIFNSTLASPVAVVRQYADYYLDNLVQCITNYAKETVHDCPTYFPPSNPNLWRGGASPSLFGAQTSHATQTLQITNGSTLALKK